ncbi:MAG TPA: type II secretion system protein [Polyangiaceae bacterium]|jgi:general secretion pathway protein G
MNIMRQMRELLVWSQRAARRARRGRWQRGVTLIEVLIVVAILAMVAGGVAVFALPKFRESQIKQAEIGARVIRTAIQQWQAANNESTCPTISQLVQEKDLDPGQNNNDPWNKPYTLNCSDDDVTVTSSGPDKQKGTKDDVIVPKPMSAQNAP